MRVVWLVGFAQQQEGCLSKVVQPVAGCQVEGKMRAVLEATLICISTPTLMSESSFDL